MWGSAVAEKKPEKSGADLGGKKQATLKVDPPDADVVNKIATMRGVSVKKLFKMQDVADFFTHLYLNELRKETERLEGSGENNDAPAGKRGRK
jgi:hypothetical protein